MGLGMVRRRLVRNVVEYENGGEGVQLGDGGLWAVAGTSPPGGRAGQIRMVFTPVGGTEASWTLSSTLAPEGRVVLTT